jgi:hypothetical protein
MYLKLFFTNSYFYHTFYGKVKIILYKVKDDSIHLIVTNISQRRTVTNISQCLHVTNFFEHHNVTKNY